MSRILLITQLVIVIPAIVTGAWGELTGNASASNILVNAISAGDWGALTGQSAAFVAHQAALLADWGAFVAEAEAVTAVLTENAYWGILVG